MNYSLWITVLNYLVFTGYLEPLRLAQTRPVCKMEDLGHDLDTSREGIRYSAAMLRRINIEQGNKTSISLSDYHKIKDLHLLRPGIVTPRGRRAGKVIVNKKKRDYREHITDRSSDHNNLINITPCFEKTLKKTEERVSLLLLNCQSVKNKDLQIRETIDEYKADIAILTETWLNDSDNDNVWIEATELNNNGLKMDTVNRKNRKGGGLAIIYKSHIKMKKGRRGATPSFEYAEWKLYFKSVTMDIVAIYRPPYSDVNQVNVKKFIDDFSDFISNILTAEKNLVILGDFNIHINNSNDSNVQAFVETTEALGLQQHVMSSSHRAGNILDHIYTEQGGNICISNCSNGAFLSDHCVIHSVLQVPKENIMKKTVTYRKYSDINRDKLREDLAFDFSNINDVNVLTDTFHENARMAVDSQAPEKTKTVIVRRHNMWFTEEVKEQKRVMRRYERIWKRTKTDEDWKALCKHKKKYRNLLKTTKREMLSAKVAECKGDAKKLYQLFNNITGKVKENPMPQERSDQELAEEFADYFIHKITNIRDSLRSIPKYVPTGQVTCELNQFKPVSEDQVKKIIFSLPTKSCELDAIPTHLLKDILPGILPIITRIINLSLQQGTFADLWKTAIVRPQIKKIGQELLLSNYRPVSNLSFLSKVLEKAALSQFMDYSDTNNLLPDYQSAYRCHFSCETALIKLMDDLLWTMENQKITALMAIDLSAAFDTVDHDVLLQVLNVKFGIGEKALDWFDSYLRPRSCKVNVKAAYSHEKDLAFSVPQGSCAGPVLYLAYASTMQEVVPDNIDLHGYADDHALKISFNPAEQTEEHNAINQLELCAQNIKEWMDKNRLKMNSSKTEYILFGSAYHLGQCTTNGLNVNGESVTLSNEIKYLGVHLDNKLTLKHQISLKCRTAMWNIQRVKLIRDVLTQSACETLLLGLVISHLDYANSLYIGLPDCDIQKLQRVQNIAAKLVLRSSDNSRDCLKKLHWLPVKLRIKHKVLTMVYKSLHGESPSYLKDLINRHQIRRQGLRSEDVYDKLEVPFARRKTFASRAYSVAAPAWWNEIPNYVKQAGNVETFKKRLKTVLFDQF